MADLESLRGLPGLVQRHERAVLEIMEQRGCSREDAIAAVAREQPLLSTAFRSAHIAHRRRLARESVGMRNYLL